MLEYENLVKIIQQGNFKETQKQVMILLNQGKSPCEIIQEGVIVALDIVGKNIF